MVQVFFFFFSRYIFKNKINAYLYECGYLYYIIMYMLDLYMLYINIIIINTVIIHIFLKQIVIFILYYIKYNNHVYLHFRYRT